MMMIKIILWSAKYHICYFKALRTWKTTLATVSNVETMIFTVQQSRFNVIYINDYAHLCSEPEYCDLVACSTKVQIINIYPTYIHVEFQRHLTP